MADPDGVGLRRDRSALASDGVTLLAIITGAAGARDAGSIATRLIDEFGSLGAVFAATATRLMTITGDQRAVTALQIFSLTMKHALTVEVRRNPILSTSDALLDYLRQSLAHRTTECVRLLHLNRRNMLIRDELLSEGTVGESPIYVREVMHRALDLGSASLIIVHNHPGGDPSPSSGDIAITRALEAGAAPLGIALLDHLVIGRFGHASFRQMGLIARA